MFLTTIILLIISLILIYTRIRRKYNYWKDRCVVYEKPTFLFGCNKDFYLGKKSDFEIFGEIYNKHKDEPYIGLFQGTRETLVIRDPDLIKHILVGDFNIFNSRGFQIQESEVLSQNLLFVSGKKWKLLKQKLTPAFTPGKLKNMMPLLAECGNQLIIRLQKQIKKENNFNLRNTIADYTTSVITSSAFGIDSETLSKDETPFRHMGRQFFEQNGNVMMTFILEQICPSIHKFVKLGRFRSIDSLFTILFKKVLRERETTNLKRNDFIDICVDLKKVAILKDPESVGGYNLKVTDELLAAQAFLFYLAGNETTETAITFSLYELAHNEVCLGKVHEEIDTLLKKYGSLTYECLEEALYLERVVKEAQRKYPPIAFLTRLSNEEYTIPNTNVTIGEGCHIIIPVLALQRDEKYFKEPSKFDPDRFLNSSIENSFVYLPFGSGPRQCLGLRLAMLQVKAGLFSLLSQFTLNSQGEYQEYLELQPISLAVKPKSFDIKAVPREF